jgi:hypothetical protein
LVSEMIQPGVVPSQLGSFRTMRRESLTGYPPQWVRFAGCDANPDGTVPQWVRFARGDAISEAGSPINGFVPHVPLRCRSKLTKVAATSGAPDTTG